MRQPLMGYTLALSNSVATGFLAWVSKSAIAQRVISLRGLQGENVKYNLIMPETANGR
jgi:hypothetical protein